MDVIINSYYPDMGEWTSGQAYAARGHKGLARGPFTHIRVIIFLLHLYVMYQEINN